MRRYGGGERCGWPHAEDGLRGVVQVYEFFCRFVGGEEEGVVD